MSLGLVGRKSREMLGRRGLPVRFEHVNLPKVIHFAEGAQAIAAPAVADFIEGRVDSVHLVYNEFKSVMQQRVVVEQLLPLAPHRRRRGRDRRGAGRLLFEPSAERIFQGLLQQLVEAQVLARWEDRLKHRVSNRHTCSRRKQSRSARYVVIGPVVDIEFEDGHLPAIYNAVRVTGQAGDRRSTSSSRSSSTSARTACARSR